MKVTDEMVEAAFRRWGNVSDAARAEGRTGLDARSTIRSIIEAALADAPETPFCSAEFRRLWGLAADRALSAEVRLEAAEAKLAKVRAYVTDTCFDQFHTQDVLDILDGGP